MAAALICSVVVGSYFKGRGVGYEAGRKSRDPEVTALQLEAERQRLAAITAEAHAEEAGRQVSIQYRDRIVTVVKEAEAATELVEVIRKDHEKANPNCDLPPSLRMLWNRTDPNRSKAEPAARANEAPVTVAELAEGVRIAQEAFEKNRAQQIALQNYIAQIQEAPPPK